MFEILDRSIEMANAVHPLARKIHARSAPLADQLRRAVESVGLNFAEARWRTGRDRVLRYRYAAGSAEEARAAIRLAIAFEYVTEREAAAAIALLDRVLAMSFRLLHARRRS